MRIGLKLNLTNSMLAVLTLALTLSPVAASAQTIAEAPSPAFTLSAKTYSTQPQPDILVFFPTSTGATASLLLRVAPSGVTTISLGPAPTGYFDPSPEAWMCYVAILQYGPTGTWTAPSDMKCYFALGGPIRAKFITLHVFPPQSGTAARAHITHNTDFSILGLPKAVVMVPQTGEPQVRPIGPNDLIPGHAGLDFPLSSGTTCFVEMAMFGNDLVPISDFLCTIPTTP